MQTLDRRLTFDTFVVGPANRLAAAAAKRAADSPGTSYNPLFIYSASGLGKSHILHGIAHHAARVHPESKVSYQALETFLAELTRSLEAGEKEAMREQYGVLDILLLDDVQFLAGQAEAQEMLLGTLDDMNRTGSQIVLASDRPPSDIDGLDARLVSRFSGGLIVDMGSPDYETRVAIVLKKAKERQATLLPGVAEAVARSPFTNVRELQGGLNRILAIQDLEERSVTAEEVSGMLGPGEEPADEFGSFVDELSRSVADAVGSEADPGRQLLLKEAEDAERRGFSAARLRRVIEQDEEPKDAEALAQQFRKDLDRLEGLQSELDAVGNPWPQVTAAILNDPDRLDEAEALLASAVEQARPFPIIPDGPTLEALGDEYPPLALGAAKKLVEGADPDYNPMYLSCSDVERRTALLAAAGRSYAAANADARIGLVTLSDFAEDLIRAISSGVAGAWRERWWSVDLLLLDGLQDLGGTEGAQDELFHLFETLKGRGGRIFLAADQVPGAIPDIDTRLSSRLASGLVVELDGADGDASVTSPSEDFAIVLGEDGRGGLFMEEEGDGGVEVHIAPVETNRGAEAGGRGASQLVDVSPPAWFPSGEKVIWEWPRLEERMIEDAD